VKDAITLGDLETIRARSANKPWVGELLAHVETLWERVCAGETREKSHTDLALRTASAGAESGTPLGVTDATLRWVALVTTKEPSRGGPIGTGQPSGTAPGSPTDPPPTPSPPDPAPPAPDPNPPPGCTFTDYKMGDPNVGFVNNQTSTAWQRQYSNASGEVAVHFDGQEMLTGWPEVECVLHATDPGWPDPNHSGTRAQVIHSIDFQTLDQEGAFSVPFRLKSDYAPQTSSSWPNWNATFSLHDFHVSGGSYLWAPQAPIGVNIATKNLNTGEAYSPPRFEIAVYGGSAYDGNWWNHGHRWYTSFPVVTGHTYIVDCYVKLSPTAGLFECHIDGQVVVPMTVVPTTWQWNDGISGLYPALENYRPSNNLLSLNGQPTWGGTPTVYYCGMRIGNTIDCATLYSP
jgi:hypothetical protein